MYINLYAASRTTVAVGDTKIELRQTTTYPWDGRIEVTVKPAKPTEFGLHLRVPGWCEGATLAVNGTAAPAESTQGYAVVRRNWKDGDTVRLDLPMPVRRVRAHARLQADIGRVALQRGPLVYCAEQADNGMDVRRLALPTESQLTAEPQPDLLGGVTVIRGTAQYLPKPEATPGGLYVPFRSATGKPTPFTAIPYYANCNRAVEAMSVWFPISVDLLPPQTIAGLSKTTASIFPAGEPPTSVNDGIEPSRSHDTSIPRFSWWDHRGTKEWIQYEFDTPHRVRAVAVYWYDDTGKGSCRPPKSWTVLYKDGDTFKPVTAAVPYGTELDGYNRVEFAPVETSALRIEAQLQPDVTAGILEWTVE